MLLALLLLLSAWAGCDPDALEDLAYTGGLTPEQRACLDQRIIEAGPEERVHASFLRIIDAYISGRRDESAALMLTHLTRYHTRDPEVAYLYATTLKEQGPQTAEQVLHWSKIALDGRYRWLNKRGNYHTMVRSLYDQINESAMLSAIQAENTYNANPSTAAQQTLEFRRRRAKYWLIISAPCLHEGRCEPQFEVEIEGVATCNDLVELDASATRGRLSDAERACLRARFRRTSRGKILEILATDADFDNDGKRWEALLAWHWNLSGGDNPNLSAGHARFLALHDSPAEAIRAADLALAGPELPNGKKGMVYGVYLLRVEMARRLLAQAKAANEANDNEDTFLELQAALARIRAYQVSLDQYCEKANCK